MITAKKFLLGSMMVCGLANGMTGCSQKDQDQDDDDKVKTEVGSAKPQEDLYGNKALFESSRSDIKFALAFVENYYPYIYWCGEAWTTGYGLTILYKPDGTYDKVIPGTKVPTIEEADKREGRYLTYEILPDIKNCVTVPMDENTLIAACILRYCIGSKNFKKSKFLKQLNAGKTGVELAKTLTGWRQQAGMPNRFYFFAALMAGKIEYADLLNLRAEGCYNLTYQDMFVYDKDHQPKCDKDNFYEWDFSKIKENLEKAKQSRTVRLNLGNGKHVNVECQLVEEIVPAYIWQEVNDKIARENRKNTAKQIALYALYVVVGTAVVQQIVRNKRKKQKQR